MSDTGGKVGNIHSVIAALRSSPESHDVNVHKDHLELYTGRDPPESWLEAGQDITEILDSDEYDSGSEFTHVGIMSIFRKPEGWLNPVKYTPLKSVLRQGSVLK